MIKIKLSNNKHQKSFGALILLKDMLRDYSIDITESDDYDYEFIAGDEFMNLHLPLKESVEWGLEQMSKKTGDYFLFHHGDSTQITGGYEVFIQSNAKYMFKKFMLSQEDYKKPSVVGKWFFGQGSILDKGYDIPNDVYSKIKLQGYTVMHNWPHLQQMQQGNPNRDVDVAAIYQGILENGNMDHEVQTDIYYTEHRKGAWDALDKINKKYNIVKGKIHPQQTNDVLNRCKIGVSPFGMAEGCYRDLEIVRSGALLLKPSMDCVISNPDWYIANETYVPVKLDWSDLNETIEKVLANYKDYQYIIDNARKKLVEEYSYEKVCLHWYNFFANQSGVESE